MQERFAGRFIQRFGFNSEPNDAFSKDYYGWVSQMAFNAKLRRKVLTESRPKAAGN